ncbi:hypothetical protein [Bosea sp. BIWAKO-01]|uniref:hypothetical protein n=1 Tax=Bosea sp. BIWAKO-01 TaxID=506668 RepID=UPI000853755E|nr:hypothetical protein [Bosea sp. BIWAKO-01]GAU85887.1 hypothetical protein BIWAKO_05835 [Bosea sp. BIWAKO-01]
MTAAPRDVGPIPAADCIWSGWYAWRPVFPSDDAGPFWLEALWHRRHPVTGRWEYRTFRSEAEKLRETSERAF